MKNKTKITAHSGFDGYEDNRIASVYAAKEMDIDCFEIDVRMTKDKVLVINHDDLLAEEDILISQTNYDDLPAYIVSAEEVLEILIDTSIHINFDIKDTDTIGYVDKLIQKYDYLDRYHLTGFECWDGKIAKEKYPHLNIHVGYVDFDYKSDEEYANTLYEKYVDSKCDGINIYHEFLGEAVIDMKNKHNISLCVWTVDGEDLIKKYVEMGVDRLTTNKVKAYINEYKN